MDCVLVAPAPAALWVLSRFSRRPAAATHPRWLRPALAAGGSRKGEAGSPRSPEMVSGRGRVSGDRPRGWLGPAAGGHGPPRSPRAGGPARAGGDVRPSGTQQGLFRQPDPHGRAWPVTPALCGDHGEGHQRTVMSQSPGSCLGERWGVGSPVLPSPQGTRFPPSFPNCLRSGAPHPRPGPLSLTLPGAGRTPQISDLPPRSQTPSSLHSASD